MKRYTKYRYLLVLWLTCLLGLVCVWALRPKPTVSYTTLGTDYSISLATPTNGIIRDNVFELGMPPAKCGEAHVILTNNSDENLTINTPDVSETIEPHLSQIFNLGTDCHWYAQLGQGCVFLGTGSPIKSQYCQFSIPRPQEHLESGRKSSSRRARK